MKHVKISVLVPGMVTAEDVLGQSKQLVLPKGLVLTDRAIARLEFHEIKSIRIEDPVGIEVEEVQEEEEELPEVATDISLFGTDTASLLAAIDLIGEDDSNEPETELQPEVQTPNVVTDLGESHFEQVQKSEEFKHFKKEFESNLEDFKGQLNDIVEKNAPIEVDNMLESTMNLLSSQKSSFGVFDMLHNMRQYDDLTFAHSMNVSLICNVFADWLGLTEEEKKLATACGMLHDIGKLKIDDAIIKKPGKLTDEEYLAIKRHPVEGYKILQHQAINEHIKSAALMHHEKCDGSGYPLKLQGDKIDPYARMVAIADVYDAMTSARVYRGALCPFTVIEMFEREGLHKYDIVFIMTFLENVINTYIDNRVALSNGDTGVIKWIDKNNLSKPMIQLANGNFIELSKMPDVKIVQIL